MTEIWKDIKGYEGLYIVSNMGRIKSLNYNHTGEEKIMKTRKRENGYYYLNLCKNNVRHSINVHRIVAETYIPNPENKPYIDHINTIRDDNRVENLRWVTPKENCNNPLTLGKIRKHKNIYQYTLDNKLIMIWDDYKDIKYEHSGLYKALKGKYKTYKGFKWSTKPLPKLHFNIHPEQGYNIFNVA